MGSARSRTPLPSSCRSLSIPRSTGRLASRFHRCEGAYDPRDGVSDNILRFDRVGWVWKLCLDAESGCWEGYLYRRVGDDGGCDRVDGGDRNY